MSMVKEKLHRGVLNLLMAAVVLILVACGNGDASSDHEADAADSETLSIGILHSMEHGSLDAVEEGFITGLEEAGYVDGENIQIQVLNSQGNQSHLQSMAQKIAEESDIAMATGTQSIQALAGIEKEKPLLFSAVTDAEAAGVVESNENPGGNITGTSNATPVDTQLDVLLSADPDAQQIGVIYNSSETNAEVQAVKALDIIEDLGLEAVETTVSNSNDVQQNLTSIIGDIDLLFVPNDNTLASTMTTVGSLAIEYQVPILAGAPEMVEDGGLVTYGVDYPQLGRQTADMAVDIIENDADPATMPVQTADNFELVINEEMAEALEIDPATLTVSE